MRGSALPSAGGPIDSAHEPLAETLRLNGATMAYPRNSEISGEGEPPSFSTESSAVVCAGERSWATADDQTGG
jgi:hypothetical protein